MAELTFLSDFDVELVDAMGSDERIVEAMLASTKGLAAADAARESVRGRLSFLIRMRHGVPLEHGAMTFRVHAPVKVWREFQRHRIGFSFSELSGRYVDLPPVFYVPPPHRPMMRREGFKSSAPVFEAPTQDEYESLCGELRIAYRTCYGSYEYMLEKGFDRGLARDVLGVGIYSVCYVTCNPRSLLHMLELRTEEAAAKRPSKPLWEIAQVAKKLEAIFAQRWPITYGVWQENGRMAP